MKVTITSVGTRGDVQPYAALGLALQAAGDQVCLATGLEHESFVQGLGLEFAGVLPDTVPWASWATLSRARRRPEERDLAPRPRLPDLLRQFAEGLARAAATSDLIISSSTGWSVGQPVADHLGIAHCAAFIHPLVPTRAFPSFYWPRLAWLPGRLDGAYNVATHRFTLWAIERLFGPALHKGLRRALGLKGLRYHRDPLVLNGYSPTLIPRPADWDDHIHVTGFWFLDSPPHWRLPERLERFLESGPPPVYIGFGSMAYARPRLIHLAMEALRRTGHRGVLATGSGTWEPESVPDDVLVIEGAPHDLLLPRVAAVLHHGGSGTTGACLRAGVPSAVVPLIHDQLLFSGCIARQGLGPPPIPDRRATVDALARAIDQVVTDQAMRARAAHFGELVRREGGVRTAVALVHGSYGAGAATPAGAGQAAGDGT